MGKILFSSVAKEICSEMFRFFYYIMKINYRKLIFIMMGEEFLFS